MAGSLYPHATHIVDIYHAREHLSDLAAHLAFIVPDPAGWLAERSAELDAGDIPTLLAAARAYPLDGIKATELERKLGYFERNAHRMRYADFTRLGMFIGSGAIEGSIKALIVQRTKKPACTGTSTAPPASSPCAPSTKAAAGSSYGPASPPAASSAPPSETPRHSDARI